MSERTLAFFALFFVCFVLFPCYIFCIPFLVMSDAVTRKNELIEWGRDIIGMGGDAWEVLINGS